MKKMKLIFMVLLVSGFVYAQEDRAQRPYGEKPSSEEMIQKGIDRMKENLELNDDQTAEIREFLEKHHEEMQNLQQRHQMVRREFVKKAMGSSYDSLIADSLFRVMTIVNGEMQKKNWLHFRDIYELCDKTQKKEFRRIMLRLNKLNSRRKYPPLSSTH